MVSVGISIVSVWIVDGKFAILLVMRLKQLIAGECCCFVGKYWAVRDVMFYNIGYHAIINL